MEQQCFDRSTYKSQLRPERDFLRVDGCRENNV